MAGRLENKSVDDICEWLEGKGFSDAVLDIIRGNFFNSTKYQWLPPGFSLEQELDGNAIAMGLASSPGPDWIKDIVPVLGVRLKIHHALRAIYNDDIVSSLPLPALLNFIFLITATISSI